MRLFEYAVLFKGKATKAQTDEGKRPEVKLLVDVTRIIAADEKEVLLTAARKIPDECLDRLDCVEIAVRPF